MLLATSLVTTKKWHSWMAKLSQDATVRLPPAQLKENAWLKDSPTLEPWRPKMRITPTMEVQATHSKRGSPDTSRIWKTKPGQEQLCPTSFGIWRRNSRAKLPRSSGPLSTDAIHWKLECQFVMFAWQKRRDYYCSMKDQSPSRQRILCFWTKEVRSMPNVDIDVNLHLDTVTTFMQK